MKVHIKKSILFFFALSISMTSFAEGLKCKGLFLDERTGIQGAFSKKSTSSNDYRDSLVRDTLNDQLDLVARKAVSWNRSEADRIEQVRLFFRDRLTNPHSLRVLESLLFRSEGDLLRSLDSTQIVSLIAEVQTEVQAKVAIRIILQEAGLRNDAGVQHRALNAFRKLKNISAEQELVFAQMTTADSLAEVGRYGNRELISDLVLAANTPQKIQALVLARLYYPELMIAEVSPMHLTNLDFVSLDFLLRLEQVKTEADANEFEISKLVKRQSLINSYQAADDRGGDTVRSGSFRGLHRHD